MGRIQSKPTLRPMVLTGFRNGVTVKAMGAAIEKAICLALELQRRRYSIGIITGTTEVVDDVIPDDNVLPSILTMLIVGHGLG